MRKSLSTKQNAFVAEYISNGGKGAEAYRAAYNSKSTPQVVGREAQRLLKHPLIAAEVAKYAEVAQVVTTDVMDRYALDQEQVARRLCYLAAYDIADTLSWADNEIKLKDSADISPEARYAITEIRRTEGGGITVKLADKRAALMDLAKLRGWITDKTQQLGPDGRPINPQAVTLVVVRK